MKKKRIGLEIRILNNLIKRYVDFSSKKGEIDAITGNNAWIIGYLSENAEEGRDVYQRDIEDHFHITRSTVSNVLSLMEQKDLILRQTVDQDGRLRKIVLTEKAQKLENLMKQDISEMEQILTKGFSEAELKIFYGFLQRVQKNVSGQQEIQPMSCKQQ
ncbi:MarR family transcriptional regulator [uncultured Sphaerochaeta sp.]|uniref:MarR family winged helix-turn-helix transcriptional regulator n=1 Tax=uncultured Sphaerochaeta sp. TaxID=886478 RepID=UPI002A0A3FC9|nr:MarR family transcriptional regulator [uncultured Sphaerochaeta sp.]